MDRVQGFAQRGAAAVSVSGVAAVITQGTSNRAQVSYPGCTVGVYFAGTNNLAPIYSDNVGTVKANPFIAASDGFYFFYAPNGLYDIRFSGTGITTPFTLGDYPLSNPGQQSQTRGVFWVTDAPFNAVGDGVTDCTAAFQAALAAAAAVFGIVQIPPGQFVVKDTLVILSAGQLIGSDHSRRSYQAALDWTKFSTRILFQPATSKPFIRITKSVAESNATDIYVGGFSVMGNSGSGFNPVTGNSTYGLLLENCAQSVFENLGVYNFNTGILIANDMRNTYQNVYVGNCVDADVRIGYAAGGYSLESTDDLFLQCDFRDSQNTAVIIENGSSMKFVSCLFEENLGWAVDVWAESDADFISCDAETNGISVPNTGTFQFHVNHQAGFNPATTFADVSANIIGGMYSGYLNGTTFLKCGYSKSVMIKGTVIKGYLNGIIADATNTAIGAIGLFGARMNVVGVQFTNATKSYGGGTGYVIFGDLGDLDIHHGVVVNTFTIDRVKTNNINLQFVSVRANNAAAIAAGLVAGDLYRSGADPDQLYIVH